MNNTKIEYRRGIDWSAVAMDHFLQHMETGASAVEAFDRVWELVIRCTPGMALKERKAIFEPIRRIVRLMPIPGLFGEVTWADEDIEQEFELLEIESTPERIAAVKQRALRRDRLQDAQIDAGFAVIRACIDELYGEEA